MHQYNITFWKMFTTILYHFLFRSIWKTPERFFSSLSISKSENVGRMVLYRMSLFLRRWSLPSCHSWKKISLDDFPIQHKYRNFIHAMQTIHVLFILFWIFFPGFLRYILQLHSHLNSTVFIISKRLTLNRIIS